MEANGASESSKRASLEILSKEELIKRCERLLVLAQKAKQAKDLVQEENTELRNKLASDNGNVANEIVEKLTEQKLQHVTTIEDLKKQIQALNSKLQSSEDKCNALDSENVSFKRQIKRLTDENECLISDLESQEKQLEQCKQLGLEQQNQLLLLEDANRKLQNDTNTEELQKMLNISLQEVKKLQGENSGLKEKIEILKINLSEKDKNIVTIGEELQNQIGDLNAQAGKNEENGKLRDKLRSYHGKIVKLAGNVKSVKEDKTEILRLFKIYTKQVEEWKEQLKVAAQQLCLHMNTTCDENVLYIKEIQQLKENIEQLEAHKTDDEKSKNLELLESVKNENLKLNGQIGDYKGQIEALIAEKDKQAENGRNLELLESVKKENQKLNSQLDDHRSQIEALILEKASLNKRLSEIELLEGVKEENQKLNDQMKVLTAEKDSISKDLSEKNQKLELVENKSEKLNRQLSDYKSQIEVLTLEKDSINERLSKISKDLELLENLKDENQKLNAELCDYIRQIEALTLEKNSIDGRLTDVVQRHQEELQVFNDQSKQDTLEIQNQIKENEKICIEYRKIISKLEQEANITNRQLDELTQKNCELQKALEHANETEQQFANKSSEEILKLIQENTELNKQLEAKRDVKQAECQTETKNDLEEGAHLKRENSELLTEMNEMNQALKERGETISKFQAHCEEIMKKLQIYETQANKNVDNISQKEDIIKALEQEIKHLKEDDKELEIQELKSEIEALKEKINGNLDSSYAESETMSTSTISRKDDDRMKDLESSWEERYSKVRALAVKLKSKVRDLSNELLKEQNEKNDLQLKCTTHIKTISSLQSQCDQLHDDLEASKIINKEYSLKLDATALESSKNKQNEDVIAKLKKEIEELKQEKINTDAWKKQISGKVQTFRKELEANKLLKKELEAKIAKLSGDLEAKEQALKAESNGHQQTKHSLEHSNSERMKNSVLNLEMQDYERSVKELSQKLEKKNEEIGKLRSQLESQKSTANAIREQNKILEERSVELKNEVTATQADIVTYKKQISELEEVISQKVNKIQDMTQLLETVRSENEELSTELSKVISEHQKHNSSLKNEKEHLRSQVLGLQQSLREVQDTLKLKEDELNIVRHEYDTYKVRAQSVLRQNQGRDVGLEEKRSEELSGLQVKCETLSSELKECKETIEILKQENDMLSQKKVTISSKLEEVASENEDLKTLYEQLTNKHQQTMIEHGETVRSLKVHAETLAQCYRQQLSEQEVRHNREIIELQSKMEKAPTPTELQFPPLPTMHREEGEGSESTETTSRSMHPVPLERLLGADTDQEMAFMKKQLSEEESKVIHLTALLADTEQDLAKHVQMNKLLKEEIRRQQRSVEREEHAENLEYMKNVVFKFVTLHSGDERSRLVPVLNTILKLSPEETQKLTLVAKGDPGLRAWSNYLPMWSSPKPS